MIIVLGVIDPRETIPHRTSELVEAGCFGEDVKNDADHVLDDWSFNELKVDAALNSSIAATFIMLAAHGMGLGCCWVKLVNDDKILEIINAPDKEYYHAGILAIGYPGEFPEARPRLPVNSISFYQKLGNPNPLVNL
ncbi:MAG: nitroreductase family protein [Bacillota bacterium]